MKNFLLLLIFGKMVLLTPNPIDISKNWSEIQINDSINCLNSGATLNIQLSLHDPIIASLKPEDDIYEKLRSEIPQNTIEAFLINEDGAKFEFTNRSFSISDFKLKRKDSVWIILKSDTAFPLNKKWKKLKIKSQKDLINVHIIWKNYGK